MSWLIDLHNNLSYGARYTDPTGKLKPLIMGMLSFVNDFKQIITEKKHEDISDLIQRAQHDMQLWNDLVHTSGAKIELTKCFIQIIHFEFGINGAPVIGYLKENFHLELIDPINNHPVRIDPISSYAAYKSLGTIQCISENQISQMKQL